MGVPCRDENNMVKLKVLCWKSIYDALGLCCNFEPPAIENTVTVTAKGAVIIRLSWDKGILWNKHVEGQILSVCSALCALITECC